MFSCLLFRQIQVLGHPSGRRCRPRSSRLLEGTAGSFGGKLILVVFKRDVWRLGSGKNKRTRRTGSPPEQPRLSRSTPLFSAATYFSKRAKAVLGLTRRYLEPGCP